MTRKQRARTRAVLVLQLERLEAEAAILRRQAQEAMEGCQELLSLIRGRMYPRYTVLDGEGRQVLVSGKVQDTGSRKLARGWLRKTVREHRLGVRMAAGEPWKPLLP